MSVLRFFKVTALPTPLVPSALYLVNGSDNKLKLYVTDKTGAVEYHTYDSVEISTLVNLLIESQKGQPNGLAALDANGNIIGSVSASIDGATSDLKHNGQYVWKTFSEQLIYRNISGGTNPAWGTLFGNQQGLLFRGSGLNQTWADIIVPNDALVGGQFYLALPFTSLASGTGSVRLGIEYHLAKGSNQMQFPAASSTIVIDTTLSANQARRPYLAVSPLITNTDMEPGAVIKMRIYRDGGVDTHTSDIHLNSVQMFYKVERLGTINPVIPYMG